ncbi:MAG: tetratricopeptide repeat protein [Clostridium sp.]|nr:tetratricopeptide repeat protein [Clostridium sp.]
MNKLLNIVNKNELSESARLEIDAQIDNIISKHKNNRYEINKLVFESVSVLTTSENYSNELASQGCIKRFWGGITGKNRELQAKIDSNLAASQYASQQTLQKLAEQNLMSFELITAVNNKLNSSIIHIENEINNVYSTLVTFFKQTKSDIIKLESRVERLEKNVNLLNWQNSIEYQMWNGIEYVDLDEVSKIICLIRDFYDITKGNWTTSDLLLLKAAMSTIEISPKLEIPYNSFINCVSQNTELIKKLFEGVNINNIEKYPKYIAISAGIKKRILLDTDEKYLVDNTVEIMRKCSCEVNELEIEEELLKIYERDEAQMNIETSVSAYDLILEMLYNLEQIKEIQYVSTLDEKLKEAEMLFSVYETEKLIPILKELMLYGITKAKYMMALLYQSGCGDLVCNNNKYNELLEQCIDENYLPAIFRKFLLREDHEEELFTYEQILQMLPDLKICAENGDMFANEICGLLSIAGLEEMFSSDEDKYEKAIEYFKEVPLFLKYYYLGELYYEKKDYEKALSYYLKSANMEYNIAEYQVGYNYMKGYGIKANPNMAFQYYKKAYEHGSLDAINEYARCYSDARGVEQDDNKAFELFSEGADKGDLNCICDLGWCYQNGRGVKKDMTKAKEYYQRASEQGDEWAEEQLKKYF